MSQNLLKILGELTLDLEFLKDAVPTDCIPIVLSAPTYYLKVAF